MTVAGILLGGYLAAKKEHFRDVSAAEVWEYVGEENNNKGYYDPSSVKWNESLATVRTVMNVHDWTTFGDLPFKSFVTDIAIDCDDWYFVMKDRFLYSENLGKGTLLRTDTIDLENLSDDDIMKIDPEHLLHKIATRICEK